MPGLGDRVGEDEIIFSDWDDIPIEKEVPVIDNTDTITPNKEIDSIESLD